MEQYCNSVKTKLSRVANKGGGSWQTRERCGERERGRIRKRETRYWKKEEKKSHGRSHVRKGWFWWHSALKWLAFFIDEPTFQRPWDTLRATIWDKFSAIRRS